MSIIYNGRVYYGSEAHPRSKAHYAITDDGHITEEDEHEGTPDRLVYIHGEMHLWESPADQPSLPDLILTATEGRITRAEKTDTWLGRLAGWPERTALRRAKKQGATP